MKIKITHVKDATLKLCCLLIAVVLVIVLAASINRLTSAAVEERTAEITVGSYNILIQPYGDASFPSHVWQDRKVIISNYIVNSDFDVLALQEARHSAQRDELMELLPNNWRIMQSHTTDGKDGENAIIWNNSTTELVDEGWEEIWPVGIYAPTDQASFNAEARWLSWVLVRDRASNAEYFVFSTHLDHVSSELRQDQIESTLSIISTITSGYDLPVIFAGDMNSSQTSSVDSTIRAAGYQSSLRDADTIVNDNYSTYQGFNNPSATGSPWVIDHIYYLPDGARALYYETDTSNYTGSDHLPVFARFSITNIVETEDPEVPIDEDDGTHDDSPAALLLPPNTGRGSSD